MSPNRHTSITDPRIRHVDFQDEKIIISYCDGRVLYSPLQWYPLLHKATDEQRKNYRLGSGGRSIHWEELDEDYEAPVFLRGLICPDREPFGCLIASDRPEDQVFVERNRRRRAGGIPREEDRPEHPSGGGV